jgi:hypothetical protein
MIGSHFAADVNTNNATAFHHLQDTMNSEGCAGFARIIASKSDDPRNTLSRNGWLVPFRVVSWIALAGAGRNTKAKTRALPDEIRVDAAALRALQSERRAKVRSFEN